MKKQKTLKEVVDWIDKQPFEQPLVISQWLYDTHKEYFEKNNIKYRVAKNI